MEAGSEMDSTLNLLYKTRKGILSNKWIIPQFLHFAEIEDDRCLPSVKWTK